MLNNKETPNTNQTNSAESLKLKHKLADLQKLSNTNEKIMKKSKYLLEYYSKRILSDYEESLNIIFMKLNENENKTISFYNKVYEIETKSLDALKIPDKLNKEELKKKNKEIDKLKTEIIRLTNSYEKNIEGLEKKNTELHKINEHNQGKYEEALNKYKGLTKENKLLHELNQELEKENHKIKVLYDKNKSKTQELKKNYLIAENKKLKQNSLTNKKGQNKEETGKKIYEKYKHYKNKYKNTSNSEKQ